MKTLIAILVLFSSSLLAAVKQEELHQNTEYYIDEILSLIPSIEKLDEIEMYNIRWMLQGLNRNNFEEKTIEFFNLFMQRVDKASEQEQDDFYRNNDQVLSPYVVANYKVNGFDEGYKYLLTLKEWDFVNGLESLWNELEYEKNEVKLIFLLEEHEDSFRNIDNNRERLFEVLIESNELSATLLFEEIKNNFFTKDISERNFNHDRLVKYCVKFKDVKCLKQYLEKENEFIADSMHRVSFKKNLTNIIIGLVEMEKFQLADEYIKKYLTSGTFIKSQLEAIIAKYPKALNIYGELADGRNVEEMEFVLRIEHLIKKHKELEGEEKSKVYDEINLLIFNNASKYSFGGTEGEKISNFFFMYAFKAFNNNNNDLAYALVNTGAINTNFEEMTIDTQQLKDLITLFIKTGNFDFANTFINAFQLDDSYKNFLYASLAVFAASEGKEEMAKLGIDKWNLFKHAEPEIKKTFFKHKDDVVVYDKHLAVNLMINSAKTYLDETSKNEVRVFVKNFIDKDYDSSIFQWQTSDIEDFLEHLIINDMIIEAVNIAKWYCEKYEEPEIQRLASSEKFKFRFIEPVFINLIKKGDFTSAFFILNYVDPTKAEDWKGQLDIATKHKELMFNGSKFIKEKNVFNKYLDYFTSDKKFNLLVDRVNLINNNWW